MRSGMSITVSAILMLTVAGCSEPRNQRVGPEYAASLGVEAEQCASTCRFVIADVQVKNLGPAPLCVPGVYSDNGGQGALMLRYGSGGDWIDLTEPYDPNPFRSIRYQTDMLELFNLPQRVIQPGETLQLRMTFDNQFALQRKPAEATLRFVGFDCLRTGRVPAAVITELSAEVSFEPRS